MQAIRFPPEVAWMNRAGLTSKKAKWLRQSGSSPGSVPVMVRSPMAAAGSSPFVGGSTMSGAVREKFIASNSFRSLVLKSFTSRSIQRRSRASSAVPALRVSTAPLGMFAASKSLVNQTDLIRPYQHDVAAAATDQQFSLIDL